MPVVLEYDESVRLDADHLARLYVDLGESGAETLLCDALEELALGLARINRQARLGDLAGVETTATQLAEVSSRIGMPSLAAAARNVASCARTGIEPALGATLARLIRVGEMGMSAIWDPQDQMG